MGFTAAKIDIDDAGDPARFDRVNWTASNGEIDHMLAKIHFTRENFPKNIDLAVDMHGRYDATTGNLITSFLAFAPTFTGGVRVAVGDWDGRCFGKRWLRSHFSTRSHYLNRTGRDCEFAMAGKRRAMPTRPK